MPITIIGVRISVKPELLAQQINVTLFAGKKRPSRPDVVFIRIIFEHRGRIALGIDGDGVKKDFFANGVAKHFLYLDQARRFQRT